MKLNEIQMGQTVRSVSNGCTNGMIGEVIQKRTGFVPEEDVVLVKWSMRLGGGSCHASTRETIVEFAPFEMYVAASLVIRFSLCDESCEKCSCDVN